jgi:Tfp pilus assembly protein PilP
MMIARLSFVAAIALVISACDEGSSAPMEREDPKKSTGSTGAELVVIKAPKGQARFMYREEGLKDPFQPFIISFVESAGKGGCPLCVPLAQLKFVGLVTGIASPRALIETDDGIGHILYRGAPIGPKSGRVVHIGNGRVLIRERLQDQLGRIRIVERALLLRSGERPILQSTDDDTDERAKGPSPDGDDDDDDDDDDKPTQPVNDLIKNSEAPTDDL